MIPVSVAETFLKKWFSRVDPACFVALWSAPSKRTQWFTVSDLEKAAKAAVALDSFGADVYYGVCPHATKSHKGRGTKKTVAVVPGIWIDIDTRPPLGSEAAHKADPETLPPSIIEVAQLVTAAGLPEPSITVETGHGAHMYWILDIPIEKSIGEKLVGEVQERVSQEASKRGWQTDMTADMSRILRIPGTTNHKISLFPKPVQILDSNDLIYSADQLSVTVTPLLKGPPLSGAGVVTSAPVGLSQPTGAVGPVTSGAVGPVSQPDPSKALSPEALKKKLLKTRRPESAGMAKKILDGESIADGGSRNATLNRAANLFGFAAPNNAPGEIAELFRPMLFKWASEPNATKTVDEEVVIVTDMIARGQADWHRIESEKLAEAESFLAVNITDARASTGRSGKYTEQELAQFAVDLGIDRPTLSQRWIIQRGDSFYVFVDGDYKKPISSQELLSSITRDLAPAPVELSKVTKTGLVRKTIVELVSEYGAVARGGILADIGARKSHYDPITQTFHEAVAPVRNLTPEFNPSIHLWLQALGGVNADKLLDWLATVVMLNRPSSALYIYGVKSSGKSMLAQGLARLWHEGGPTLLDNIMGSFNADLARCPLLWADEILPHEWGKKSASTKLRDLITADTHTLNRKFLPSATLTGNIRLILTANNDAMLSLGDDDATAEDAEAFASRFFFLQATQAASDYLVSIGGRNYGTVGWVSEDKIASHVLWLSANRVVNLGDRLCVEGDSAANAESLASRSDLGDAILEWVARYLDEPGSSVKGVHIGDGKIRLSAKALVDSWQAYNQAMRQPSVGKLGRALARLSEKESERILVKGERKRFYNLKPAVVFEYAERTGVGHVDDIKERLAQPSGLDNPLDRSN